MPLYEYVCLKCGKEHEILQKFSDDPVKTCPDCKGEMKKLISNTSFVLKGNGWYATDYASPKQKKERDSDKKEKTPEKKTDKGEKATPAAAQ